MAQLLGYVKSLQNGIFFAKNLEGEIRELKAGDQIFKDELIYGASTNSHNAHIIIGVTLTDTSDIALSGTGQVYTDLSVIAGTFEKEDAVVSTDTLENAWKLSTNTSMTDSTTPLDATAAGIEAPAAGQVLTDGEHASSVTFYDRTGVVGDVRTDLPSIQNGNATPSSVKIAAVDTFYTYDITAPKVSVNSIALTNDNTPALSGTVNDPAATVVVTIDGKDYTAANNGNGTWTLADNAVAALKDGTTPVSVKATDVAGNTSSDSGSVTVDDAPVITLGTVTTFTEDAVNVKEGAIVATYTVADKDSDPVNIQLSNNTYYYLDGKGNVLLSASGATFVNSGKDLPAFTLTPNDGHINGSSVSVDPSVIFVNDAPVFIASNSMNIVDGEDSAIATLAGGNGTYKGSLLLNLLATDQDDTTLYLGKVNGVDVDSVKGYDTTLTFNYTDKSGNPATLTATLHVNADGSFAIANVSDLNPIPAGVQATASLNFNIRDDEGAQTATAKTINLTIIGDNDVPVATPNSVSGAEDTTIAVGLTGTDIDGTIASVTVTALPTIAQGVLYYADGTTPVSTTTALTPAEAAHLVFKPTLNFNGDVTISFNVIDNSGAHSSSANEVITVTPVNDAPVAVNDTLSATEDPVTSIIFKASDLLGNDTDVDTAHSALKIASVTSVDNGTAVLNADGTVTFTPYANFSGDAHFTYTITDGAATSNAATATVNVTPVADKPILSSIPDIFVSHEGATVIATNNSDTVLTQQDTNTGSGISQVNLETELGLASGTLDGFNPTGTKVTDNGNVDVIDGKVTESHYSMSSGTTVSWNYSFINGEDDATQIANGYNDLVVLVVTDPNGNKSSILVNSSEVSYTTMTNNGTYSYTATVNGEYTFDWLVLNGRDANKDSSLSLSNANFTLSGSQTVYSAPIALSSLIHASLTDTDGSESLSYTISGVPSDAAFTAGTHNNDGTWTFTEAQLGNNLYLLPADNYTGTLHLTVTATATEHIGGSTASVSDSFDIVVNETSSTYTSATEGNNIITGTNNADLIRGYVGDDVINGGQGDDIIYGGAGNDKLDGGAGNDKLYGGAGNDTFVYDSVDSKIDGGAGTDTLLFNAKTTIDFSTLDSNNDPIKNIEVFDLTQAKVTIQNLSLNDVLDMTEAGAGNIHALTIQGANDDVVNVPVASGNYTVAKTNTGGFDVYTYSHTGDPTVIVKIDQDIQHS